MNVNTMYDYAISHDFLMKTILPNVEDIKKMTIDEFFEWFKTKVNTYLDKETYSFRNKIVTFEFINPEKKKIKYNN